MMNPTLATIDLFNVVVASETGLNLSHAPYGFVTNFQPTQEQIEVLRERFKALSIITLFSVRERETASLDQLLLKQLLHYVEVYGLESPGLFNLEVIGGRVQTISYVKAISIGELDKKITELLYANRPIDDIAPVLEIISHYKILYDFNKIKNNELKVALFDICRDTFVSGDDAVRYICYKATKSTLLIKSKDVIQKVAVSQPSDEFLSKHVKPLAQVFNRHKRIILACKNKLNRGVINRISKLSKKAHVPIHEAVSKRFISSAVNGKVPTNLLDTEAITLRDKLKYLNLIEYRLLELPFDTFLIRNGKVWAETERAILDPSKLTTLRELILKSICKDLSELRGKSILLDPAVDYGLPTSRKQVVGRLPFGTRVEVDPHDEVLSAGIYWHNDSWEGQSIDLDLSAISSSGGRTGWGHYSSFTSKDIVFSGDITSAPEGAMEFMMVHPNETNRYGLMVNVYKGPDECPMEIVVGSSNKKDWLDLAIIREKIVLKSKQSIIGFLKDDTFVVYTGRLSNSRVSAGKHPVIDKGLGNLWTIKTLLDECKVKYDFVPKAGLVYDFDLTYQNFSLDKLEILLGV